MGVMNPGLVMRCIIPVVMAGVLGIYGLIVAVIIQGASKKITWLLLFCFVNCELEAYVVSYKLHCIMHHSKQLRFYG